MIKMGVDSITEGVNNERLHVISAHYPAGTSVQLMKHLK
jgi:hypothetical protein